MVSKTYFSDRNITVVLPDELDEYKVDYFRCEDEIQIRIKKKFNLDDMEFVNDGCNTAKILDKLNENGIRVEHIDFFAEKYLLLDVFGDKVNRVDVAKALDIPTNRITTLKLFEGVYCIARRDE